MSSWKDYFTHSKSERNGTIVLSTILVGMIIFLQISKGLVASDVTDFQQYEEEVNAFYAEQEAKARHRSNAYTATPELHEDDHAEAPTLFEFDPNDLPVDDWIKLGLTQKQAKSIHNYEGKGGQFRKKEDLAKMYVIDDEMYQRLEPFIAIKAEPASTPAEKPKQFESTYPKKAPIIVNINTADSATLTQLRGIGPSYAKRIIKYRNMLGGFASASQLLEVYGMEQERLDGFIENIELTADNLFQININNCEADALRNHPYISWNVANALVNYRKNHGPFETLEDIKKCNLVNDELYGKIVAYLSLQ